MKAALRQVITRPQFCRAAWDRIALARLYSHYDKQFFKTGNLYYIGGGLAFAVNYLAHSEKVPETGRRRFMAVSRQQEEFLSKQCHDNVLQKYRGRILPSDHPIVTEVRRITRRIIRASNLGHLEGDLLEQVTRSGQLPAMKKEWVVLVINDRSIEHAFSTPGLICVSTGFMPLAQNEEGLAAILAHEIAHVVLRHSAETVSLPKIFPLITYPLCMLGIRPMIWRFRAMETEADTLGLKLLSRACYDPDAAPRFFENLEKDEEVRMFKFFSTHPPTAERIAHLKTLLPESYKIYNSSNPECSQLKEMRSRGYLGFRPINRRH